MRSRWHSRQTSAFVDESGVPEVNEGSKEIRVLVLWCDSRAANFGLRVLASGNAELVRRALGDGEVVIDFQDFGPGDSDVSFGTRSILRDLFRSRGPIKSKLRQYDLIVDSGAGDSFTDIYGLKRLAFIAYAHRAISRLGIPLVLAPQTIGPFNSWIGRMVGRRSLRQARLVMSRDSESSAYSAKLGRQADVTATDVVFCLPSAAVASVPVYDVLVNVSGLLWFADDHVDSEKYRRQVTRLVVDLRERGRRPALLAHVIFSPSGHDDVDACRDLAHRIRHEHGFDIDVVVPADLIEMRQVLAGASVVVGARMHACLNAMSMGTPAVPWAYSRKFIPLMRDLGWTHVVDLRADAEPVAKTIALVFEAPLEAELECVRDAAQERLDDAVRALAGAIPVEQAR